MMQDESFYQALRRPPKASDFQLTGLAIEWLLSFPTQYRPHNLAKQYPRVVNTLAAKWADPAEYSAELQECIFSSRKEKRQGFPAPSLQDLLTLMDAYNQQNGRFASGCEVAQS
jgi:hypothetical protein